MRLCGRRYGEARRVIQRRPFSSCKKPKIIFTFVAAQATDLCDWPSKNSEWVILMWGNFPEPKNRFSREAAIRHISGTMLCALLLLFFCTNARLARRLCEEIDARVKAFLDRPLEGDWPYVWLDATYVKVRRNHRIVSVAVIVAVGVNSDGRSEVVGMDIGPSEAETFWVEFLRKLRRRGLRGVKLVVSDADEGIKAAVAKLMNATWRATACAPSAIRWLVPARAGGTSSPPSWHRLRSGRRRGRQGAVAQGRRPAPAEARQARRLHGRGRGRRARLHELSADHRPKIHSTNGLERLNGEIKRRTEVVGIFPNDEAIIRLVGAILLEQNDEWAVQRARYMTLETIAALSDDPVVGLPAVVDRPTRPRRRAADAQAPATPRPGTRPIYTIAPSGGPPKPVSRLGFPRSRSACYAA